MAGGFIPPAFFSPGFRRYGKQPISSATCLR
jgi:hypothetical protein